MGWEIGLLVATFGLFGALRLIAIKHNFDVTKWNGLTRRMTDELQNAMIGLALLGYGFSLIQMATGLPDVLITTMLIAGAAVGATTLLVPFALRKSFTRQRFVKAIGVPLLGTALPLGAAGPDIMLELLSSWIG